jgi:hypothetical protein
VVSPSTTASQLTAAQAAADQGWLGLVSDSVTPAVSYPPSSLSPTHERPTAGPPSAANIALDSTLEPDDLADVVEAHSAKRKGPDTLSEIPTRAAGIAGLAPIPAYNEAKTMPALRSLPITEQATQAKLSPDLFNLATSIKGVAPDFSGMAQASAMPAGSAPPESVTLAAAAPPTQVAAPPFVAPVAAHAAPTPAAGTPAPQFESLRDLEAVSIIDDVPASAPSTAAADKSTPSRPPRVSQLIKALQQGQIDQFQALQQASGNREPPAAASPVPAVARPAATGSQAVVGPASSSPSGPTPQGRVSPGLMALAPPPAANGDSPWGTSSQAVMAPQLPKVPAPVGLRGFLLRNQEVAAALIGAMFVLLIGIAFLLFR